MHIAFIHPSSPSAEGTGATHSATQIVTGLSEAGHSIDVYCAAEPQLDKTTSNLELLHLRDKSRHPHTNTKLNREIQARLNKFSKYDIVHSYLPSLIPSVAEISEKLDISTVVTLNAYGGVCAKNDLLYLNKEQCRSKSKKKCLSCISQTGFSGNEHGYIYQMVSQMFSLRSINASEHRIEHINGFRAPSGHVRDNYTKFGFNSEKIHVIPHPLNDAFLVEHKSDFSEPINLLYVGSLKKHKGVEKLVPVVQGLWQDDIKVQLTIVGTGGLQSKMEQQTAELDVENQVTFAEFVPNEQLPELYASHDIFIHPGIWEEPLARVYIEALATGTPIVTREYGSIRSIIGEGGVTTNGSVESYVRVISKLVRNNKLSSLSKGAKSYVERYSRKKVVTQLEEVYRSIL